MSPSLDMARQFDLHGKRAVVLGGLGSLGRVGCRALASAGASVLIVDAGAEALLAARAEVADTYGVAVHTLALRPDDQAGMATMIETANQTMGGIDILFVAAGSNIAKPTIDMTPEEWDSVMQTNVRISWLAAQAAGRAMIAAGRGGKIVLMSSTRGKLGHPAGYSAYVPAKHAVEGLVRALGCEWGPHGINVNGIGPTVFRSNLSAWMFEDADPGRAVRNAMLARIPMGRLGEAEDLAGILVFLCSAASDFCTGQVMYVDGGYTAG